MDLADAFNQMGVVAKACLLVPGLVVAMSVVYAIHPNERRLALMRPLSLATIFAALCGFTVGMVVVLQGIGVTQTPINWRQVALGASESVVPLFVAFGCLTVSWLIVALGMRRT